MKDDALTDKQERFAQLRAAGKNCGDAHIEAGYKKLATRKSNEVNGQRVGATPKVKARIEELQAKSADDLGIDTHFVLKGFIENIEAAKHAGNLPAVHKGYESLGKHLGLFKEIQEIHSFDHHIDSLSIDELLTYIKGMCSEIGLRVVDQTDEEKYAWIIRNAPRVGIRLAPGSGEAEGDQSEEAISLSPLH